MTNRSRRSAADRAEARRRARLAAQGRDEEFDAEEELDPSAADRAPQPGGSFLTRLFPPAPPLPGKGDPLAGFTYEGPLRGVVASLYLLARHPVPWIGMGTLWAASRLTVTGTAIDLIASLVAFGALIAAGWIGWQKPWLFGLMASVFGILLYAGILYALIAGAPDAPYTPAQAGLGTIYQEVQTFQPVFGAIAGWYGGYLRRRMAATTPSRAQASRRR
jgi:hypothetical protein